MLGAGQPMTEGAAALRSVARAPDSASESEPGKVLLGSEPGPVLLGSEPGPVLSGSEPGPGSVDDFARIYQEHFAFVWRSLLRLGVPEATADDAAQDVFVVVYRQLDRFAKRSSLKTWLFGICINVARDSRRLARRKGGNEALDDLPVEPSTGAERETGRLAAAQLLDRALGALDDEKRAVFILAELEGMTAPEIAAATGIQLNTVYSRLRVAREQFQAAFATEEARR